jgi:hypothetical protein
MFHIRGGCGHEVEAGADHEADADLPGGDVRAHDPGKGVAVGQRDCGETELGGAQDQLLGVRAPAQEREVAGDLQLGVGSHQRQGAVAIPCS